MLHTLSAVLLDLIRVLAHEGLIIKIVKGKKCASILVVNNNFIVFFLEKISNKMSEGFQNVPNINLCRKIDTIRKHFPVSLPPIIQRIKYVTYESMTINFIYAHDVALRRKRVLIRNTY